MNQPQPHGQPAYPPPNYPVPPTAGPLASETPDDVAAGQAAAAAAAGPGRTVAAGEPAPQPVYARPGYAQAASTQAAYAQPASTQPASAQPADAARLNGAHHADEHYFAEPPPAPAPVVDPHPHQATDWSYQPRPETEPGKPAPAEWGWRARVRSLSGGLIPLAPGPAELAHRTAIARIRAALPGSRTVVVANEKGGAGKTPTALVLSALLAEYRREAVIAWDVNELRGTLGRRAEVTDPQLTVTDVLAAAAELARPDAEVGLLTSFLRRQPEGNLVLASSEDGNAMRQIGHRECDIVRQLLLRRFGIVVCDTGNNAAAPNFLYTVDSADVLVLPTAPSDVHLEVARAMLRMLASRETTRHLVARAVLVVTSSTGARLEPEEERWFAERIGRVVHVPADPVIAQGGKLAVSRLSEESTQAWTQVAGAVVQAALAPSPHDKPRGRRRAPEGPAGTATGPAPQPSQSAPAEPNGWFSVPGGPDQGR
ncbi:MAG TPA: hypothetical protein VHO01_02365 [Jatrophihabitans sp.]|nr:hypothetical protein [Jatrophihabitans sp.]